MRFLGASFSLNNTTIPSTTLVIEPVMAGDIIPSQAVFKFLYGTLGSSDIQVLASYTTATLAATWPSGAVFQASVQVSMAGASVTSITVLNRRVLGVGPLGLVTLARNTYPNDPIPVHTTYAPTYSITAGQALIVTCTVLQNTLIRTPQFTGLVY